MPCSHLDVVPTLLDLLGVEAAPSVLAADPNRTVCAFTDWGDLLVAARRGRWKLIHDVATGRDRLFDVERDPAERIDAAALEPAIVVALRAEAVAFLRAATSRSRS